MQEIDFTHVIEALTLEAHFGLQVLAGLAIAACGVSAAVLGAFVIADRIKGRAR